MPRRTRAKASAKVMAPVAVTPPITVRHARFWRCALQVNPEGYSLNYRGRDHGLKGEAFLVALAEACQENSIAMVGLADHGSVRDVAPIRSFLGDRGIVVLPGFEICSSEKIHWVCLFPEDTAEDKLDRVLGSLDLLDPDDGVRPSRLSGSQLLSRVRELGGLTIAAHATNDKGILKQKANHLWKDPNLDAAQIPGILDGLPQAYRQIASNADAAYKRDRPLALINARDVARPADLAERECSSLIKMTNPGFEGLKIALHDPESRVRLLSDLTDTHCGRIDRIEVDAGYLDGLQVHLSPHLNALIGGRGTGNDVGPVRIQVVARVKQPRRSVRPDAG